MNSLVFENNVMIVNAEGFALGYLRVQCSLLIPANQVWIFLPMILAVAFRL